jgi:hypothetical protein
MLQDIAYIAVTIHVFCKCMSKCFTCFRPMLQVFHLDVAYVAMLNMFQIASVYSKCFSSVSDVRCKCVYLDVVVVIHICLKCMFVNDSPVFILQH